MSNNKGFTLVELLVAISILGILSLLSLPIINQVNENSENSKYEKYTETMVSGAKLYVDSYAIDLFGYDENGCVEVSFEELKEKGLVKDIQIKDVTCTNGEVTNDTYVKIKKTNGKYEYQEAIKCVDSKGTVVFEKTIDTPICGENINDKPQLTTIPTEAPTSYISSGRISIKAKVSDATGLANNNHVHYGWAIANQPMSSISNKEWHRLDFGNAEGAKEAEKSISIFPVNQNQSYDLYIKPTYVQDISGNISAKIIKLGPYKFDNVPPVCPTVTKTEPEKNTITNKDEVKLTGITFSEDTKKYRFEYRFKAVDETSYGDWKLTEKKNVTATPIFEAEEGTGDYEIKLRVYDEAGNEGGVKTSCSTLGPFKIRTPLPKVTITAYKRNASTHANEGSALKSATAEGKTATLALDNWINKSTGGVNLSVKVSNVDASMIKSIKWKYNDTGSEKFVDSPTYKTTENRELKSGSDLVFLTGNGYRQGIYIVEDTEGHVSEIKVKIKIDRTAPSLTLTSYERKESTGKNGDKVTSITANNDDPEKTMAPDRWFNKSTGGVNLSISTSDGLSGVSSTASFKYNKSGTTQFYDNPSLPNGGNRTISSGKDTTSLESSGYRQGTYKITDKAGNTATVKLKFKIDRTSPAKPSSLSNSSGGKCTTKDITVSAKSSDGMSGIQKWQYKFGSDGSWNNESDGATFSIKLTSNRNKTMYIRSVDKAGNVSSSVTTKVIKKDNCNSWPVNNCKIRGSKKRNAGYGWTCSSGHYHTTGYLHFCSKSNGDLCVTEYGKKFGFPKCSKNTYTYVCPTNPYGTKHGWYIASGK